ncbi:MAG: M24 family metallopeptidase [Candidatus Aminicenantes bacterium]|nr:M24 family metallopeptidase [Candidatus Aminicenantes bacterium]
MFDPKTYIKRRDLLRKQVGSGIALFLGNAESPMNYPANTYHFRQDSSFLYFFGLDSPGLAAVADLEEGRDVLFGDDISLEDVIWMGDLPTLKSRALRVGAKATAPAKDLASFLAEASAKGRTIHYLPPYRTDHFVALESLLGVKAGEAKTRASRALIQAVVAQRSVKSEAEVAEIEAALLTTYKMYETAMRMAQPGVYEKDIAGRVDGIAIAAAGATAFPTILTKNGQILHNHDHGNKLKKGDLVVIDAGAESAMHYASDITRTVPAGGTFSLRQREIYEIVLEAQETAIRSIAPGVPYKEVHLRAARTIAAGLHAVGLMTGDAGEAVAQGAHALFFPHGLGHMLGLDVHDMENLGENHVGYDETVERSKQFGLAYLRLAKELRPGYVLTVEPGVYFIPALIDKWKKEKKFREFIPYEKLEPYKTFGGIRLEDNVLVTKTGGRVLGKPIPKAPAKVEAAVRL